MARAWLRSGRRIPTGAELASCNDAVVAWGASIGDFSFGKEGRDRAQKLIGGHRVEPNEHALNENAAPTMTKIAENDVTY